MHPRALALLLCFPALAVAEEVRLQDAVVVKVKPTNDQLRLVAFGQPEGSRRLGTIQPGQSYVKVGTAGRAGRQLTRILWRAEGPRYAYVAAEALQEAPSAPKYLVTTGALNIRSRASASSARVQANGNPLQLKSGWVVAGDGAAQQVGPESRGWLKVAYAGKTGFVSTRYLRLATNAAAVNQRDARRETDANRGAAAQPDRSRSGDASPAAGRGTSADRGSGSGQRDTAQPRVSTPPSRRGFIQLPASGTGFYAYGVASKRWGTQRAVYGVMRVAQRWSGIGPALGIGNISLQNGGPMRPHKTHRDGTDVDVRPIRSDGARGPVTIAQRAYSRPLTRRVLELFREVVGVQFVYFNDRGVPGVRPIAGHDNHFHVRVR